MNSKQQRRSHLLSNPSQKEPFDCKHKLAVIGNEASRQSRILQISSHVKQFTAAEDGLEMSDDVASPARNLSLAEES